MAKPPIFGNGPGLKPLVAGLVFGEPILEIHIAMDQKGLMKTSLVRYPPGNPPSQLQIMGMLIDSLHGQLQGMMQSASLIINPNKEITPNGGQKEENHNHRGGNPPGGDSRTGD